MHLWIWLCYSTVWHFQRPQPLHVHSVSSMSMCRCSTWVFTGQMSEVWALLGLHWGLIGTNNQFSAGRLWSLPPLFLQAIISEPKVCRCTGKAPWEACWHQSNKKNSSMTIWKFQTVLLFRLPFSFSFCREQLCPPAHIHHRQTLIIWQLPL